VREVYLQSRLLKKNFNQLSNRRLSLSLFTIGISEEDRPPGLVAGALTAIADGRAVSLSLAMALVFASVTRIHRALAPSVS